MGTIGVIDINPTRTAHGKPTTRQIAALILPVRASAGREDRGKKGGWNESHAFYRAERQVD